MEGRVGFRGFYLTLDVILSVGFIQQSKLKGAYSGLSVYEWAKSKVLPALMFPCFNKKYKLLEGVLLLKLVYNFYFKNYKIIRKMWCKLSKHLNSTRINFGSKPFLEL